MRNKTNIPFPKQNGAENSLQRKRLSAALSLPAIPVFQKIKTNPVESSSEENGLKNNAGNPDLNDAGENKNSLLTAFTAKQGEEKVSGATPAAFQLKAVSKSPGAEKQPGAVKPVTDFKPLPVVGNQPVQRNVVDDTDEAKVVLDRFNRLTECAQVIAAQIYVTKYRENPQGISSFDGLFDAVEEAFQQNPDIIGQIQDEELSVKISEIASTVAKTAYKTWLAKAKAETQKGSLPPDHESMMKMSSDLFGHYNLYDQNMIWRFTSRPSTEQIYITKGISSEEIVKVVAAHSGGNDKANEDVKTLSFGRNPAALMGVAASAGGDKHVMNIIDKAEYLYGIDINSLASKGVSAHAAVSRAISLFESEYVLLNTPGFPSISLDQLATVKYKNPFKASAIKSMLTPKESAGMQGVVKKMGSVEPEKVSDAREMDKVFANSILTNALSVKKAATGFSGMVMDKEATDMGLASRALTNFNKSMKLKV